MRVVAEALSCLLVNFEISSSRPVQGRRTTYKSVEFELYYKENSWEKLKFTALEIILMEPLLGGKKKQNKKIDKELKMLEKKSRLSWPALR